eukprot:GHVS01030077.1.p1 GENE.GHVS01030077.1~~GHVS01030077.1.p1  ORF type:complete len:331 (+),score=30.64 GHVS01030077.1:78-995(+)
MVLLLAIGLFGAIVPIYLRKFRLSRTLGLCSAFAGGAFLALGMFHILPDAVEDLEEAGLVIRIGTKTYNSAYLFLFAGFVLILFCESIIFVPEHHPHHNVEVLDIPHDVDLEKMQPPIVEHSLNNSGRELASMTATTEATTETSVDTPRKEDLDGWRYMFKSGGIFLMLALAIHGLFEGVVVGTNVDVLGVWMSTLVIFGHKWAESFSLMTQFLETEMGVRSIWLLIGTFVLSSPIGVAIGIAASEGKAASGVCNALGAGTILYVAAEITGSVFSVDPQHRFSKFLVYLFGSGGVLGLTLLELAI